MARPPFSGESTLRGGGAARHNRPRRRQAACAAVRARCQAVRQVNPNLRHGHPADLGGGPAVATAQPPRPLPPRRRRRVLDTVAVLGRIERPRRRIVRRQAVAIFHPANQLAASLGRHSLQQVRRLVPLHVRPILADHQPEPSQDAFRGSPPPVQFVERHPPAGGQPVEDAAPRGRLLCSGSSRQAAAGVRPTDQAAGRECSWLFLRNLPRSTGGGERHAVRDRRAAGRRQLNQVVHGLSRVLQIADAWSPLPEGEGPRVHNL